MSESVLEIDGKSYISSTRAAELVGYTKDYVGQLARGGKLESKLVGRTWYVSEDSIRKHKLAVHYTLTKPKKPRRTGTGGEIQNNEKTNVLLDISYNNSSRKQHKQPPSYSEIAPTHDEINFENDETDLFPLTHNRKGKDVLIHTDIYFEPAPYAGIRESNGILNENEAPQQTFSPIRTTTKTGRTISKTSDMRRERRITTNWPHFDGIIPTNYKEKQPRQTTVADPTSTGLEEKRERRTGRRVKHHTTATRFHIFPLVMAITTFLIIALAYFFA